MDGSIAVATTITPTQSCCGGGEADHEAACGETELDSDIMLHDHVELIPEKATGSPAQQLSSSAFRGEDWNAYSQRWSDRIRSQGVQENLGTRVEDKGATAGLAYDKAAIDRGLLDRRNFGDDKLHETAPTSSAAQQKSSRFRGVCWDARSRKWRSTTYFKGVQKYLGNFDDEEAAAQAYDKAAIERGILHLLNFNDYDLPSSASSAAPQRQFSEFRGVSWHKRSRKWNVRLYVQGANKNLGSFDNEEAAAQAYDKAAIECGLLDRLNFDDYEFPVTASAASAAKQDISRFRGVCWHKTCRA
jgi:hypothetical protein